MATYTDTPDVTAPEVAARLAWLRFSYKRVLDCAKWELEDEEYEELTALNEEHVYVTGEGIEPMTDAEVTEWYRGGGAAVRAVLGDYVQF